ncbi:MAG TPA: hypothetical protein VGG34_10245 [Opitutaceae bacterium]|jgi:hypothetical protein
MNRGLLVLLAGLAVGVGTHAAYFNLHRPPDPGTLDGQLAWMKSELHLSDAQFGRIRQLHEASSPRLRALASQVAHMQAEFEAFERTRKATDEVDFLQFAQFVETRRNVDRECIDSTRELVMASANQMTPAQRARYLGIVAATNSPLGPSSAN